MNTPNLSTKFVAEYLVMVRKASNEYGKASKFFLACAQYLARTAARCTLTRFESEDGIDAYFLDQRGLMKSACCGHPSVEDDRRIAAKGSAFIGEVMGWTVKPYRNE